MLAGCRKPQRVAVFISGSGSTLQALLDMHHNLDVAIVVTNRLSALGCLKAKRYGKPVLYFSKNNSFEELTTILEQHNISKIFLAGFMKILPAEFVDHWAGKILNIHPSLLPEYKGLNSIANSWANNSNMGCTIHYVTKEMDDGEIYLQKTSLEEPKKYNFLEAEIFLRSCEQELLRQVSVRWAV